MVTVVNPIFALTYPTESTYRVLATATANNLFSIEESTLVIEGNLSPKPTERCELPSFALVMPTVSVTQPTCTTAGSYMLGSLVGDVVWTVDGTGDVINGICPATAGSSRVTISAAPAVEGDGLDPDWSNPVVVTLTAPRWHLHVRPADPCVRSPTLACTGLTIGTGLSLAAGLLFVGFARLLIARRRKLTRWRPGRARATPRIAPGRVGTPYPHFGAVLYPCPPKGGQIYWFLPVWIFPPNLILRTAIDHSTSCTRAPMRVQEVVADFRPQAGNSPPAIPED